MTEDLDSHGVQADLLGIEIFYQFRAPSAGEASIETINPCVIGTGDDFCLTAALKQLMTSMLSDVVESAQFAVLAFTGEYALSLNLSCNITTRFGEVLLMTQKLPTLVEYLLALKIKKVRVPVAVRMQRV